MITPADIDPSPAMSGEVEDSRELKRILDLPWRAPLRLDVEELSDFLGSDGSMTLRPIQAATLVQLYENYGCFASIPVSGGKTLISYLAPRIMEAKHPIILVPAKLREKTKRDFRSLEKVWGPVQGLTDRLDEAIVSYWDLSNRVGILDDRNPDLLVADEVHRLKSRNAACTQRFLWWRENNMEVPLCLMSGTVTSRSLMDFNHLLEAVLGRRRMPLPASSLECVRWARAVDEKVEIRCAPGALRAFLPRLEQPPKIKDYRRAVGDRIFDSEGVIRQFAVDVSASICLEIIRPRLPTAVRTLMQEMERTKLDVNGDPLTASDIWRHRKTFALGFHHQWVEPGPEPWLKARRSYLKQVREISELQIRELDTEKRIRVAIERGDFPSKRLERWLDIKNTFKPKTIAVWHTETIVDDIINRARRMGNVWIWVEHQRFAAKLVEKTGWPYFHNNGFCGKQYVEDHRCGPAIVSIKACREGLNLQHFNKNIVTYVDPMGEVWEQKIGRTHRTGQEADVVEFIVYASYQGDDFAQALADAKYQQETTRQPKKLLMADIIQ